MNDEDLNIRIVCLENTKCENCSLTFQNNLDYSSHASLCFPLKKNKCEKCSESFNMDFNMLLHSSIHENHSTETGNRSCVTCPVCNIEFNRLSSFKGHLNLHKVSDALLCPLCYKEFEFYNDIKSHIAVCSGRKSENGLKSRLSCKKCSCVFKRPLDLIEHNIFHRKINETMKTKNRKTVEKAHHGVNRHLSKICDICHKQFPSISLLARHKAVHTGIKAFTCQICQKSFTQPGSLKFHMAKHMDDKPYKCQLCGAGFTQRGNLRTHVSRLHPPNPDTGFVCPVCSCIFRKRNMFNQHLLKRHQIPTMPASFRNRQFFPAKRGRKKKTDFAVSVSDKKKASYSCKSAQKLAKNAQTFVQTEQNTLLATSTLLQHQMTDSLSGLHFSVPLNMISKNNHRYYQCPYCPRLLRRSSDLVRHIRTHSGEKPYRCTICSRGFALKQTMQVHLQRHSRIRLQRCFLCLFEFPARTLLRAHLATVHPEIFNNVQYGAPNWQSKSDLVWKNKLRQFRYAQKKYSMIKGQSSTDMPLLREGCPCSQCAKVFTTKQARRRHFLALHSAVNRFFVCPWCRRRFSRGDTCRRHMRRWHNPNAKAAGDSHDGRPVVQFFASHQHLNQESSYFLQYQTYSSDQNQPGPSISSMYHHNNEDLQNIDHNQSINNQYHHHQNQQANFDSPFSAPLAQNDDFASHLNFTSPHNAPDPNLNSMATLPTLSFSLFSPDPLCNVDDFRPFESPPVLTTPILDRPDSSTFTIATANNNFANQTQNVNFYGGNNTNTEPIVYSIQNMDDPVVEVVTSSSNELVPFIFDKSVKLRNQSQNNSTLQQRFQCSYCQTSRIFFNQSHLNSHVELLHKNQNVDNMGMQNANKPSTSTTLHFQPENVNFDLWSVNNNSEEISTMDKKHPCQYCGRGFKRPIDLERHLRTHTGEKPFSCDHCKRAFTTKSTLNVHIKADVCSRQKPEGHICQVCSKVYANKKALNGHITAKHRPLGPNVKRKISRNNQSFQEEMDSEDEMLNQRNSAHVTTLRRILPNDDIMNRTNNNNYV